MSSSSSLTVQDVLSPVLASVALKDEVKMRIFILGKIPNERD